MMRTNFEWVAQVPMEQIRFVVGAAGRERWNPTSRETRARCGAPGDSGGARVKKRVPCTCHRQAAPSLISKTNTKKNVHPIGRVHVLFAGAFDTIQAACSSALEPVQPFSHPLCSSFRSTSLSRTWVLFPARVRQQPFSGSAEPRPGFCLLRQALP
jgi:hypothetical protein